MKFYFLTKTMPSGAEWEYTFLMDFDIADHFGVPAVKDTYRRVIKAWGKDIKAISEVYIALNMRLWYWYDKGNAALAEVYDELFYKLRDFVYEKGRFSKEDLSYFFEMTD